MKPQPSAPTSAAVAANPEIFDRAHLARYTLDSAELEREIVDLFLLQLPDTVAMIGAAASAADWRLATHSLKGSAAAVGARRLCRIAEALEALAVTESRDRPGLLGELTAACDEFRALAAQIYA